MQEYGRRAVWSAKTHHYLSCHVRSCRITPCHCPHLPIQHRDELALLGGADQLEVLPAVSGVQFIDQPEPGEGELSCRAVPQLRQLH